MVKVPVRSLKASRPAWQAMPPGVNKDDLIREFRVVKLSELDTLDLPRVTPPQRQAQMDARDAAYASRARE